MATICHRCGEENPDSAERCEACGAILDSSPKIEGMPSGRGLIAIFVVALLVVGAIVIAPLLYDHGTRPNGNGRDTDTIPDQWWEKYGLDPDTNDPQEDLDGDGLTNIEEYRLDTHPLDSDTDNDDVIDSQDLIPLHDAGIRVTIDSIRIKDFVEGIWPFYKPTGEFFCRVYVDGAPVDSMPATPADLEIDVTQTVNWSVTVNVPDDHHPTVRLELYADKGVGRTELVDINGQNNSKDPAGYYLKINYYLGLGDVGRVQTGGSDGSDDGNRGLQDDKDAAITWTIETINMSTG